MGEPIMNLFLEKSYDEVNELENRYNYIPPFISQQNEMKSLDKLCLKTTLAIAKIKGKGIETTQMESKLVEFRQYALQHFI